MRRKDLSILTNYMRESSEAVRVLSLVHSNQREHARTHFFEALPFRLLNAHLDFESVLVLDLLLNVVREPNWACLLALPPFEKVRKSLV